MTVLVDVGNTRIKWATLERGALARTGGAVHRGALDAALAAFAAALPKSPGRVVVANVAGEAMAARIEKLVAARCGVRHRRRDGRDVRRCRCHRRAPRWLDLA
jgi:type III pantothenate kinase